jgi:hypothetical protein
VSLWTDKPNEIVGEGRLYALPPLTGELPRLAELPGPPGQVVRKLDEKADILTFAFQAKDG